MYKLYPDNFNGYWYFTIKNCFSDQQLEDIEKLIKQSSPEEKGTLSKGDDTLIRTSTIRWVHANNQSLSELYQTLIELIHRANNTHFKFSLTHLEPLQYTEYYGRDNGHYDFHVDDTIMLTHNNESRKLSFTLLLNDPETDYEGGDFLFRRGGGEIEKADISKGDIMFFASPVPHKVDIVTKGTRKSLVGWVRGPCWK
jgi:PKHD-type hydroxylase